jgi:hypothetical protein
MNPRQLPGLKIGWLAMDQYMGRIVEIKSIDNESYETEDGGTVSYETVLCESIVAFRNDDWVNHKEEYVTEGYYLIGLPVLPAQFGTFGENLDVVCFMCGKEMQSSDVEDDIIIYAICPVCSGG